MIADLWNNCVSYANRAFFKSGIYKRVFNQTDDAQDVLSDLLNFCGAYDFDLKQSKNGTIDPLDMARRAGKLEVYQYVSKLLSMDETQKHALAMRYYALQNRQNGEFK
jgi:hypothetical protein